MPRLLSRLVLYLKYNIFYIYYFILLKLISISAKKCKKCDEGFKRVRNNITETCDCISGYKEDSKTKLCIKCYKYNNKCVFKCPNSTYLNEETGTCEKINSVLVDDTS